MQALPIFACPSCDNTTFRATKDGEIYCDTCTMLLHYNILEHIWTAARADNGFIRFVNESKFTTFSDFSDPIPEDDENNEENEEES